VFEDEMSCAFLDYRPLLHGHVLLAPKQHYETLIDLSSPLVGPLFANVQLLARVIESGLEAGGTFVGINNGVGLILTIELLSPSAQGDDLLRESDLTLISLCQQGPRPIKALTLAQGPEGEDRLATRVAPAHPRRMRFRF
jgi:hypothetical protein